MTTAAATHTAVTADYLKALHALASEAQDGDGAISSGALAARLGIAPPSASAMLRKLQADGLVTVEPYRGARLTDAGTHAALQAIRTHRLLERLLLELGLGWDEVHAEADRLEHAISPHLLTVIDQWLGHPDTDPHGAPIPLADGTIPATENTVCPLAELELGRRTVITRVRDGSPELLRYLTGLGLTPGTPCTLTDRAPFGGPLTVELAAGVVTIGAPAAASVLVRAA